MPFPLPFCPWLPLFEHTLALLEYLLHVVFLGDSVQEPVIRQKKSSKQTEVVRSLILVQCSISIPPEYVRKPKVF